ncbi:hypothetical protein OU787_26840 [Kitasatospora sp. YST-16]|uniref:hypothetical protein n=1 Tax=Kitasatospora sp. YST-16 TaxID=2998080 RepID=UPI00228495E6|nr:hypothetical protein [Kitasatospora sp. YST-16]WAL74802.1 hypothetical protein OU787_26840 [Kitasatospora sp. YST-16]WNW40856.1 hypothetical protein RKE32_26775 [Streptomyces sp. Li-HN-5-13]
MNDALRQRTWEIAEQLSRAGGGGEARLTTIADGFRIELSIIRPDGPDDPPAVLAALALGDRWGHSYSPAFRNNGVAREIVWSEVHHPAPKPEPENT